MFIIIQFVQSGERTSVKSVLRSMYALQDSIREDSEIGNHQRQRRRSSFIDDTFRKYVPLHLWA